MPGRLILAAAATALLASLLSRNCHAGQGLWRAYVGTYTGGDSEGIYLVALDRNTGALTLRGLAQAVDDPSFLALHPSLPILYAVCESSGGGDCVSAYKIDPVSGMMSPLEGGNRHPAGGTGPCHVAVSPDASHLAVANYGSGSTAVFPLSVEGYIGTCSAFFQHEGKGIDPKRQAGPHAHSVCFDKTGQFLAVSDLGLDQVLLFRKSDDLYVPHTTPSIAVTQGAGPRHFTYHPTLPCAYVINELNNTVTVFEWDEGAGQLEIAQTVTTLPEGYTESNSTAEIAVHPSGRFLYGSNRGHDSIAAFAIDPVTGLLHPLGHTATGGKTPRNFAITPDGQYLLAANQQSNTIVPFRIDQETGGLEQSGPPLEVPSPVCIVFSSL